MDPHATVSAEVPLGTKADNHHKIVISIRYQVVSIKYLDLDSCVLSLVTKRQDQ